MRHDVLFDLNCRNLSLKAFILGDNPACTSLGKKPSRKVFFRLKSYVVDEKKIIAQKLSTNRRIICIVEDKNMVIAKNNFKMRFL